MNNTLKCESCFLYNVFVHLKMSPWSLEYQTQAKMVRAEDTSSPSESADRTQESLEACCLQEAQVSGTIQAGLQKGVHPPRAI